MSAFRRPLSCLLLLLLSLGPQPSPAASDPSMQPPAVWTAPKAVHFALNHSPDALAARERIRAADADLRSAGAAFLPRLDVSGEYSRTNNPMYSFGNILNQGVFTNRIDFNDPGTTDDLQAKTTLSYRLYNGGRDSAELAAADERNRARVHQLSAINSRLGFEVVRAFCTIVQAADTIRARQSALAAIEASLSVARARYGEGALLREDLLNLEVQQARAKEQLIQARHGHSLAQRAFLHLLGLTGESVHLDCDTSPEQTIPVERDVGRRPELAAMAAMVKAREAMVRQARAGDLPTADAFGSLQVDQGSELDQGSGSSWMAGVRLNYTLFDGRRTASAVQRAEAELAEARAEQRRLELSCNLEKEQAVLALSQEEERLKVTGTMVASAEESARLARLRFKEGVVLSSELIETENRLTDARLSHALATAARKIAIADLRRAVGLAQFDSGNQP